jgi:hypothetical protein
MNFCPFFVLTSSDASGLLMIAWPKRSSISAMTARRTGASTRGVSAFREAGKFLSAQLIGGGCEIEEGRGHIIWIAQLGGAVSGASRQARGTPSRALGEYLNKEIVSDRMLARYRLESR